MKPPVEQPKKLRIDRSRWLNGSTILVDGSWLREPELVAYRREPKMCCLGFLALELGHTEGEIEGIRTPEALRCHQPVEERAAFDAAWPGDIDGQTYRRLMRLNDISTNYPVEDMAPVRSEEHREKLITEVFRELGIEVEFFTSEVGS